MQREYSPSPTAVVAGDTIPAILIPGLKLCCLLTYAGGAAAALAGFSYPLAHLLRLAAGFVLTVHALQVVLFWRQLRPYPRGMPASILQTLLFGLLHWVPMHWQAQRRAIAPAERDASG